MIKVICNIDDKGKISVNFLGDNLRKRGLLQLLKAIRLEYRRRVRLYRRQMLVDASVERKKLDGIETEAEVAKLGVDDNGKDKITE